MIILKNKTYNDLILKIRKLESDLKKQIEKNKQCSMYSKFRAFYK